MQKKQILFKTKGMNRDLSASAFKPEFSFENINIRLATSESNTKMSQVNERGTKEVSFNTDGYWEDESSLSLQSEIKGKAIGTAVLNNKLVVFTVGEASSAEEEARLDALIAEQKTLKSSYEREKTNKEAEKVTIQNLEIIKVDMEDNCILVKGSIPGPKKGMVMIKTAVKTDKKNDAFDLISYEELVDVKEETAAEEVSENTEA